MADSSNEEFNYEEEITDVSPLLADRAFLSDSTSDDEAERTSGVDNSLARETELFSASLQDATPNEHDQNIISSSLLSTSSKATFNQREEETRSFLSFSAGLNISAGYRNFCDALTANQLSERNPRRSDVSRSSPRGLYQGRNIFSPLSTDNNNTLENLSPRTTPENRCSPILYRESENDLIEDETMPFLHQRDNDSQLLNRRVRELSDTSPRDGAQYSITPPMYSTISSSLSFDGAFSSTMRSPRLNWEESVENRRFSPQFYSTLLSRKCVSEDHISSRGFSRQTRGRILTSTPRDAVRRLSFSLDMRELSLMIDPPAFPEDDNDVPDDGATRASGAVLAEDRLKKGRDSPEKPGDNKEKESKSRRHTN